MKSFKQYITEIFDNPFEYNMIQFSKDYTYAYFFTEEKKLFCVDVEEENKVVEVVFKSYPNFESDMWRHFKLKPPFDYKKPFDDEDSILDYFNLEDGTDEKLDIDTKDVNRIFATVIKIVEEYYNEYKPITIIFKAKNSEANRVTLYNKIAKRFAKKYNFELKAKTYTRSTKFTLNKKL